MFRGRLISIVVALCLVAMLVPVVSAYAGQSVQLTGKAQVEFVSVSLDTTDTLDYGSGAPGQTVTRSFTARNTGTLATDWDLVGCDATDTANDVWCLGSMCGASQFAWAAKGSGLNSIKLSKTWLRLADGVSANSTRCVDLAFTFPSTAKTSLVHNAAVTLRATAAGGGAATAQSIAFDNTTGTHQTLTAPVNTPLDITFNPSTMGCSANIHFTSGSFTKTSAAMQNVTLHTDGLPAGTYDWKCSMTDCCYGTLVVQ